MITLPIDTLAQTAPYVQEQQGVPARLSTQLLAKAATPLTFTPDATAPVLVASSGEVNKRSDLSLDKLQLTFNEAIQLGAGVIELRKASDNSLVERFSHGAGSVGGYVLVESVGGYVLVESVDGPGLPPPPTRLTIYPFVNLSPDTRYYLLIAEHAIRDGAYNPFAGVFDSHTLEFTTEKPDVNAPTLLPFDAQSSVNQSSGLPLSDDLKLTFNEAIQLGTGFIELRKAADNSLVERFKNGVGSQGGWLSLGNNWTNYPPAGEFSTVILNPFADLTPDTRYYLSFSAEVIKDLAGNAFKEGSAPRVISFSTLSRKGPQLLPPEQQLALNSANIAKTVVVGFNEDVQLGKGFIELRRLPDHRLIDTFANYASVNGGYIDVNGSNITFDFAQELQAATQYYLSPSSDAITDAAGNAFMGLAELAALRFTTPAPDTVAPMLYLTQQEAAVPSYYYEEPTLLFNNQQAVPLTANLPLHFNEELLLGDGEIVLHNAENGLVVESFRNSVGSAGGFASVSLDYRNPKNGIVTLNPAADLSPATAYYLTITDKAITDKAGNAFAGFSSPDTFRFSSQSTPSFLGFGASLLAATTHLTLNFKEAVRIGNGNAVLHNAADKRVIETFQRGIGAQDGYMALTGTGMGVELVTYAPLSPDTDYYLTLDANAITNKAGLAFPSGSETLTLKFRQPLTVNTENPMLKQPLTLTSWIDNSIGVAVGSDLTFRFNHEIKLGAGPIALHNADTNQVVETFSSGIGSAGGTLVLTETGSPSTSEVAINPAVDLAPATQYYLTIDNSAISDTQGEVFKGFTDTDTLNFFTAGVNAPEPTLPPPPLTPQLRVFSPRNHQGAVMIDADLVFTFVRNIRLGSGNIELHKLSDGSLVERFSQGRGSAGGSATATAASSKVEGPFTLTINPFADLAPSTAYYLTVTKNAISDTEGHAVPAVNDPKQFNFTTEAQEYTAPFLTDSNPVDNQTDVSDSIYLSFNENIYFGTGTIAIHRSSDGSVVESFKHGKGSAGGAVTINGSDVTLRPTLANFKLATPYYLTIDNQALTDRWGNAFQGFSDPTQFNFTTLPPDTTAPELTIALPVDNETRVIVNNDIYLDFNEDIRLGKGPIELRKAADNSVVERFVQGIGSNGGILNTGSSGKTSTYITINPGTDLQLGTAYYLLAAADAITDLAGNAFKGFSDPDSFNFKTVGQ